MVGQLDGHGVGQRRVDELLAHVAGADGELPRLVALPHGGVHMTVLGIPVSVHPHQVRSQPATTATAATAATADLMARPVAGAQREVEDEEIDLLTSLDGDDPRTARGTVTVLRRRVAGEVTHLAVDEAYRSVVTLIVVSAGGTRSNLTVVNCNK